MIPRRHQVLEHPQAEGEVIVLLGAIGLAEEKPGCRRQGSRPDGMLQGIKVGGVELEVHSIEILGRAALGTVEILHPAMEVRMLASQV